MSRTILFDFDGVLMRGDAGARLVRTLIRAQAGRRLVALLVLPIALPLLRVRRTLSLGARIFIRIALLGQRPGEIERAVARDVARSPARRVPAAWERLAAHRAAGDRIVVVTGCAAPLARALLDAGGAADIALVASELAPIGGRWRAGRHCYGPMKVRMLAERGIAAPWDVAYSDSDADLPLLRGAREPVLVSPTPTARRRVTRALPGIAVVDW